MGYDCCFLGVFSFTYVGGVLLFILSFSWLTALMGMVVTVFLRER